MSQPLKEQDYCKTILMDTVVKLEDFQEKNDTLNNYDTLEEETDDLKNRLQALEKELDAKNKIVNSRKVDDHSGCIEEREQMERKLAELERKLKTVKDQVLE
ncbi:CMF_collapsed_G0013200.mRNA.1.CDS.1 [Saccharomyces cerevisiae]|nr:CMF_collapsed_G0013200.mRNA.1.CDS.1 [Saccharomyces cerevisiae]